MDLQDYQTELVKHMSDAWSLARQHIIAAQCKQKKQYDKDSSDKVLKIGDRVMVKMPGEIKGEFARPYHGSYQVLSITPTNLEVRLVDQPDQSVFL